VGTFRASADGQTEDSAAKRFVWNMYNRRVRTLRKTDTTDTWTYSTAAYQQANASAANQIAFVQGLVEDVVEVQVRALCTNSTSTARNVSAGIGLDSTTVNSATLTDYIQVNTLTRNFGAQYSGYPSVGYHAMMWLELGGGADTQTWMGDNAGTAQTGMTGRILA
jgi:hypothetical protein